MAKQPDLTVIPTDQRSGDLLLETGSPDGDKVPPGRRAKREAPAREWNSALGYITKLVLMAAVDALGVYLLWSTWQADSWGLFAGSLAIMVAVNWIYFSRRTIPLKYVAPGLIFLLVFQIFTMIYTGYVAFTNYGSGHNSTKSQAVDALLIQNEQRTENSPTYPLTIVERDDTLGFAIVEDGAVLVGDAESPLSEVDDAVVTDGRATEIPDWDIVDRATVLGDQSIQDKVLALRVPVSDEASDGSIRTREGTTGAVYLSVLDWNPDSDTMTNTATGVVYTPNDVGQFESESGEVLPVGWRVNIGFENFTKAFTDSNYSGPFLKILTWTIVFAVVSVASAFLLGLVLAMIFDDTRLKGRKILRTLIILPFGFPAFMSALLWRGMLNANPDYGIINQLFFFGTRIEWLSDPMLAKLAIILVNLWLSFPYWFLVCTGAIQSLPGHVMEAARVDGASKFRTFRSIQLPLLLVATAPLLISSFAFTFNNFTLIYMLTEGGPRFSDTSAPLGATDILITMVYQISGVSGGRADFGLASALSILIFIIVGGISALAFRQTRKLEEMS